MNNQIHKELSKRLTKLITIKNNEGIKSIEIPRKIECSFTYINSIVSHLKEKGFVTHEVVGRSKPLRITNKGRNALKELQNYIKKGDDKKW